jgi:putative endonuclease
MDKLFYVYIITNKPFGTLYTGMTNDLARRMFEHKSGLIEGFSKKYNLKSLVYYEPHATHDEAFTREHQIKK